MKTKLKPCPFCGSPAEPYAYGAGGYGVRCSNAECHCDYFHHYMDEAEAASRWNTRAKRTCHAEIDWDAMEDGISGYRIWKCSCGEQFLHFRGLKPSFCPHCGAKVVE